jgi:Cu/Ag efflux protein CusF
MPHAAPAGGDEDDGMTSGPTRTAWLKWLSPVVLTLAGALLAMGPGCREGGSRSGDAPPANARRYTVRGEIVRLPSPAAARQVSLRHEPIDDFANEAGAVVGMGSMVMPFDVAPEVALDDVRVGDKVEVRIAVSWSPPVLRVEQLRKLPAETVLRFGEAHPKATTHP